MAPKRAAPPPPKPAAAATADPSSASEEEDGDMSSTDSSSHHQEVADENPVYEEEEEDADEESAEEDADEDSAEEDADEESAEEEEADLQPPSKSADLPLPVAPEEGEADLQPPRKSADLPVPVAPEEEEADLQPPSKSADLPVPAAPEEEDEEDADLQPSAKSPARKRKRASGEIAKSPEHQQGGEKEVSKRKSEKVRRIWAPDDEVQILVALADLRRQHGKLPKNLDNLFVDSIAERLQDKGWDRRGIKDKVRSLRRRYDKDPVSTTPHEKRLNDLSTQVWEDLPEALAANGTTTAGTENGGGQTQDKSFGQMCELYPRLAKEVKLLAAVEPSLESSFNRLDDKRARSIEGKLEKVSLMELKIQNEMMTKVDAPKAKIKKKLVNLLMKVSKSVSRR